MTGNRMTRPLYDCSLGWPGFVENLGTHTDGKTRTWCGIPVIIEPDFHKWQFEIRQGQQA